LADPVAEGSPPGPGARQGGHGRDGGRAAPRPGLRPRRPHLPAGGGAGGRGGGGAAGGGGPPPPPQGPLCRRAGPPPRRLRHPFQMSLSGGGRALTGAFFHVLVRGGAVPLALAGSLSFGDIWTLSLLFLNVMTPLSEVHRVVVEGHESTLHVGQLLDLLAEPV